MTAAATQFIGLKSFSLFSVRKEEKKNILSEPSIEFVLNKEVRFF